MSGRFRKFLRFCASPTCARSRYGTLLLSSRSVRSHKYRVAGRSPTLCSDCMAAFRLHGLATCEREQQQVVAGICTSRIEVAIDMRRLAAFGVGDAESGCAEAPWLSGALCLFVVCSPSSTTTMPAKAHRPSGPNRSHSRTSSGGSSKLGLNLQITQKEPPPPRVADKTKKSAHFHHEVRPLHARRSARNRLMRHV